MNHDEKNIKRCYELAVQAGRKGFDTFGAVLVHNGKIIEEAENTAEEDATSETDGDTAVAEDNKEDLSSDTSDKIENTNSYYVENGICKKV